MNNTTFSKKQTHFNKEKNTYCVMAIFVKIEIAILLLKKFKHKKRSSTESKKKKKFASMRSKGGENNHSTNL